MKNGALVVRWGRSSYERGAALQRERHRVQELGLQCLQVEPDAPLSYLSGAHVLVVTSRQRVNGQVLGAIPGLELLLTTTSGYDHLDLQAARDLGIMVGRMPIARRDAVVEASLGLLLALLRDLPRMQRDARGGKWVRSQLPDRRIVRLESLNVGVVGLGVIGSRMVQVLDFLGANVITWDPSVELEGYQRMVPPRMFSQCRAVTLHCRLERGAAPVVDGRILAGARQDLILVNTARGGVLDLEAAVRALDESRIRGLAVDVFPREPYPDISALAERPGVLVTPHAAGYHVGLADAITDELVLALEAWMKGREIPNRIA